MLDATRPMTYKVVIGATIAQAQVAEATDTWVCTMVVLKNVIPFRSEGHQIEFVMGKRFSRDRLAVFTPDEFVGLTNYLAAHPDGGVVIPGTGGLRKLRWGAKGKGTSGGARVIYYFRDLNFPLFFLAVYAKGERADLTVAELREIERKIALVVERMCWRDGFVAIPRQPA